MGAMQLWVARSENSGAEGKHTVPADLPPALPAAHLPAQLLPGHLLQDHNNVTPVVLAAKSGFEDEVQLFIQAGADLDGVSHGPVLKHSF